MPESNKITIVIDGDASNLEDEVKRARRQLADGYKRLRDDAGAVKTPTQKLMDSFRRLGAVSSKATGIIAEEFDDFVPGIGRGTRALRGLNLGWTAVAASASAAAGAIGLVYAGITKAAQTERQIGRIEALVKATGFAAGFTAEQLDELARQVAASTLASTSEVRDAIGVLLTFKNVSGDTFQRVINLGADLAETMGTDLKGATLQLAKALEDPVAQLGNLTESGVSFSEAEKEIIKDLAKSNRLFEAQSKILDKVSGQFGEAGAGAGAGLIGQLDLVGQRWGEFLGIIGNAGPLNIATRAVAAIAEEMTNLNFLLNRSDESRLGELLGTQYELEQQLKLIEALGHGTEDTAIALAVVNREIELVNRTISDKTAAREAARRLSRTTRITNQIQTLEKSLVDERSALTKVLESEDIEFQRERLTRARDSANEEVTINQRALDESLAASKKYQKDILDLQAERLNIRRSIADEIRDIVRSEKGPAEQQADLESQITTKILGARDALKAGDAETSKALSAEARSLTTRIEDNEKRIALLTGIEENLLALNESRIESATRAKAAEDERVTQLTKNAESARSAAAGLAAELDNLGRIDPKIEISENIGEIIAKVINLKQELASLNAQAAQSRTTGPPIRALPSGQGTPAGQGSQPVDGAGQQQLNIYLGEQTAKVFANPDQARALTDMLAEASRGV